MHHVYTLWGIEGYRDAGGKVPLPWTRGQALRSLDHFWKNGGVTEFDQDPPDNKKPDTKPARLCGAGMLLLGYAAWGDPRRGVEVVQWIDKQCGPWPQLRPSPIGKPDMVMLASVRTFSWDWPGWLMILISYRRQIGKKKGANRSNGNQLTSIRAWNTSSRQFPRKERLPGSGCSNVWWSN